MLPQPGIVRLRVAFCIGRKPIGQAANQIAQRFRGDGQIHLGQDTAEVQAGQLRPGYLPQIQHAG